MTTNCSITYEVTNSYLLVVVHEYSYYGQRPGRVYLPGLNTKLPILLSIGSE